MTLLSQREALGLSPRLEPGVENGDWILNAQACNNIRFFSSHFIDLISHLTIPISLGTNICVFPGPGIREEPSVSRNASLQTQNY